MKALFLSCTLLIGSLFGTPTELVQPTSTPNDLPPRLEWFNNNGYCGETCFIIAGLYYGQYLSQYDVRAIASPGLPQPQAELLLGQNDTYTAGQLCLNATVGPKDTASFLNWIGTNVQNGYPVAIGIYANQSIFNDSTDPNAGDPDYDHIVTVIDWPSQSITFTDNGLYGDQPQYIFSYPLATFPMTRQEANNPSGPIYSLPSDVSNYGIVFTGVIDEKGETFPVRLRTNINSEIPAILDGSNTRPAPCPVQLAVTVSGLQPNVPYIVYKYNNVASVPHSDFNMYAGNAYESFPFMIQSGSSFSFIDPIQSDDIAIYRAVRAP